jgi:hypothetical protein
MLRGGMSTAPAFLSWALAVAPVRQSDTDAPVAYAAPVVEADEYTTRAGHRTRWASAKYVLPDGKIAEVFIIADDTASGEATISVDGEAIVSSSYDERRGVTRWISPSQGRARQPQQPSPLSPSKGAMSYSTRSLPMSSWRSRAAIGARRSCVRASIFGAH